MWRVYVLKLMRKKAQLIMYSAYKIIPGHWCEDCKYYEHTTRN